MSCTECATEASLWYPSLQSHKEQENDASKESGITAPPTLCSGDQMKKATAIMLTILPMFSRSVNAMLAESIKGKGDAYQVLICHLGNRK